MPSFIPVSLAVVIKNTDEGAKVLLQKRVEDGPLNGLLEFPGGKVEPSEDPESCALRELHEETGLKLEKTSVYERIGPYKYDYPDRCVCLFVVLMRQDASRENDSGHWELLPTTFVESDWEKKVPDANLMIIKDLIDWVKTNAFK